MDFIFGDCEGMLLGGLVRIIVGNLWGGVRRKGLFFCLEERLFLIRGFRE